MNKTININLGGLFFHIDEKAYQKLNRYLNSIRKSLSDDPQGRDEIIKDIELRISELLSERIVDERQVVSETDIDDIVVIMGQPEDYNVDEEIFNDSSSTYTKHTSKKLFRDGDDKFLGGVASGTAHYLGMEPIWSRILWIVFGLTQVGILVYILLWVLLPEAKSTADKLEMEGETVNIDNIEKKIREEFSAISDRVKESATDVSGKIKEGSKDISDKIKKKYSEKTKSGLQDFLDTVGDIILMLLKVFAKFIGALIIFIAAITLLGLIVGLFSWGSLEFLGFGENFFQFPSEIMNTYLPHWLVILFVFAAIGIPFIVLFMLGLKILSSNAKSFGKVTSLTLLAIWIISILGLIFSGIDISSKYNYSGIDNSKHEMNITATDTLHISMIGNDDFNKIRRYSNNTNIISDNGTRKLHSNNIDVDIRKSDTEIAYMKIRKSAHGRNYEGANSNAQNIEYQFNLNETKLKLNDYFLNDLNSYYGQQIDVIIYLPEGFTVYLDKTTKYYLDDVANVQNVYDRNMVKHHYIMGESELNCLDCDDKYYDKDSKEEDINIKIDTEGVQLKIKSQEGDVEVKLDSSGLTIK